MVRSAREKRGLTQESLAAAANVSLATIRNIEASRRGDGKPVRPTAAVLHSLARVLSLEPERMFALAGRTFTPLSPVESQQQIADSIRQLPPHLRNAVVAVVNALGEDNLVAEASAGVDAA
jgi:transcriptional regulator with XRE-family HTH domain